MVVLNLLSLAILAFTLAMLGFMLVTFRKAKTVTRRGCAVSILISLAVLAVYWVFVGSSLPAETISLILAAGLALGAFRGRTTEVWEEKGVYRAKNSMWFLAVFGACYAFSQLLASLGQALSLNAGIAAMCLGTGVAIGAQGTLYRKIGRGAKPASRSKKAPAYKPPKPRFCKNCGAELAGNEAFCRKCGAKAK
jgi:hypothetical protein